MQKPLSKTEVRSKINSDHYYIADTKANKRVLQDQLDQTRIIVQYHNGQVLGGMFIAEFF